MAIRSEDKKEYIIRYWNNFDKFKKQEVFKDYDLAWDRLHRCEIGNYDNTELIMVEYKRLIAFGGEAVSGIPYKTNGERDYQKLSILEKISQKGKFV
jgi:hypothetical protein